MARWEPNARGRLEEAAFELFAEHGFEQVTVAEIAGRAGLTERTFYRHFADKREVLFPDANPLVTGLAEALERAPEAPHPIATVAAVLEDAGGFFADRHAYSRRRNAVIAANAELREREAVKLALMADTLAGGLRARGVPDPAASLAAEAGIAVFKVAHARWVADPEPRDLRELMRDAMRQLKAVTAEA
ncbi:TetR/AcrR family transcriptional regulator [Glycomyces albidus]|jgi:AcrR family transcriptional regulator|uniref:TetR family transcriptional regulator n=1 Tax=Glycomyces albidus TaxID=2656774 RepID=A0A6L5G9B8_9ACTN|nr:TetR/AcrR family transcriptional regulator [Glycomyces albidus]MQM26289.1 TetR family transcriptional regulator [Glycomyces albidus]